MRLPLETSLPYHIPALLVLTVFYGIYLVKQWRQKRVESVQCKSGAEYLKYRHQVLRYLGRRKG